MKQWKNLLLIAGTNRNVGKTTLSCKIINELAKTQAVIAIKVTPHFHSQCNSCQMLYTENNLQITEELSIHTLKDSSKMKAAGAKHVYYVQGNDKKMPVVLEFLQKLIPNNLPIVCESAALRNFVEPGKFILLSGDLEPGKNLHFIPWANIHLESFDFSSLHYSFDTDGWEVVLKKV
jgi:hypothetical protein